MSYSLSITTDTHVFFYSGREIWSNWHRTPKQIVDPRYKAISPSSYGQDFFTFESSEQHFMWLKAMFFGDFDTAAKISDECYPRNAKELGRLVKNYDDSSWGCVRLGFMTYSNLLKYRQNPEWGAQLKATGDRILVEASPEDKIWGVGLSVEEAAKHVEETAFLGKYIVWPGRNLLGEALMTVRGLL